jgi:PEP-CTERM motif
MKIWRCLLVLASFIPATWAGPIIFDTLGPLNLVAPGPGLTVGAGILRGDPVGHQGATYAEAFPPPPPGMALGSIDLFVQYLDIPGLATGPANLDVSIAADGINQPGAILETIHLTNIFNSVPFASGVITANSVLHPLSSGPAPYWLIVAPPDLLNTAFDWKISAAPLTIPLASRLGADPWSTSPNQALAFRITAADVPEPASWFLAAAGLLLLIAGSRRIGYRV